MSSINPNFTSLLVDQWHDCQRAAMVSRGVLQNLWLRKPDSLYVPGAVFRGQIVRRLDRHLAMVRLDDRGIEARLFHKKDIGSNQLLVQMTADAVQNAHEAKDAECSNEIKLAGRFMIYLPFGDDILVSRRIGDTEKRARIRTQFRNWGAVGGWIIRSSAVMASDEQLAFEAGYLMARWRRIEPRTKEINNGLIMAAPSLAVAIITDYGFPNPVEMVFSDAAMASETRDWCSLAAPELETAIRVDPGRPGPFELRDIEGQIEQLSRPLVTLPEGGNLIIEKTSALHVIDVNAGAASRKPALHNNKIAAAEIARQIRLRGLSGMILIDFLKMDHDSERAELIETCREQFALDPVPTQIHGMTRLGLMELTRQRRNQPADIMSRITATGTIGEFA